MTEDALDFAALLHDNGFQWDDANAVNAILTHHELVVLRVPVADTAGIDAAWREAEAALPEGWVVGQLERTAPTSRAKWWATAYRDNGPNENYSTKAGDGAVTPAAALLALAAALRTPKPEGETE